MIDRKHRSHPAKPFRRPIQRELAPLSEAAAILGRSPRTLRRWIARGDLPAHRLQGHLLVKLDDVRALIMRSRVVPRAVENDAAYVTQPVGPLAVHSSAPAQHADEPGASVVGRNRTKAAQR
jgi:excisionase family DNA binding protein